MGPLDQRNLSKQKFRNLSNSKNLLNGIFRAKNSTMNNILTQALLRIVNHPACWPGLLLKCQSCCYRCTTKNKPWNQVLFSEMTFARFCNFNFCRSFWREILNFGWLHKLIFRKFTEPALLWLTLDFQSPAVHEQGQVQHHSDTNNGLTIISVLLHPCAASSQDSCPHWVNVTSSLTSRAQLFLPPANMLLSYQQVIYFPESLKCWGGESNFSSFFFVEENAKHSLSPNWEVFTKLCPDLWPQSAEWTWEATSYSVWEW